MAVEALVTPLLRVDLFQGLAPLHLAKLAQLAERIVYRPGDVIIRDGGVGDASFLIVAGDTARIDGPHVDRDAEEAIPSLTLIGEMAMLIETEHSSTVIAKSQVRALKFPRASLHELMQQEPSLAEHFIGKLTHRLQQLAGELRLIDQSLGESASEPISARALYSPHAAATGLH